MGKETGGAAFPHNENWRMDSGMTLRDYFAAKVIGGMFSSAEMVDAISDLADIDKIAPAQKMAELAYATADAMLAERSKP